METASELAAKAADPFWQQGTLGATVVALAIALVLVVTLGWRALDKKDKKIFDLQEARLNDVRVSLTSVTAAIATIDRAAAALLERGRR